MPFSMTQHWIRSIVFIGPGVYDTKIDLQCTGLVGPQSIYRSLCRSITMHASTEKSGGSKSYYSIACYNAIWY